MTSPKAKLALANSYNRVIQDKVSDIVSSKDFGGLSDGITDDYLAINLAIAALAAAYPAATLIIPANTIYTEAALVLHSNVTIMDLSSAGKLRILTKDEGLTLPITKGGMEISSQGKDGVLLRSHDSGVAGNPYLQVVNSVSGQLAGLVASFARLSEYADISEIGTPAAPAANTARLFVKDSGAGKTQLCVRFNTGAVQILSTEP